MSSVRQMQAAELVALVCRVTTREEEGQEQKKEMTAFREKLRIYESEV